MNAIKPAIFPEDLERVITIFREYVASPSVNLDFQDYESEFAALPGKYAAPEGRLLLAWKNGAVVGCAALRKVDASVCEMKRVYVQPAARGDGLGRRLVESTIAAAREAGYSRICLDVLPEFTQAQHMYASLGFRPTAPVTFNPVPGTQFLGLDLISSC
ncbi:GNAT family N-acetyltransferase [Simplicispira metamorpha]|uniref:Acetyltransferase (GNAT) family protein n=1 Tax=Simplicispira metamorpha TaxID=80881 RepID=A0A4R2N215_9BURK|nr:GNAT family N-acetyltransferase [Simplicispira metamorpha]TCP13718.1 acetyltransferase (GNAT) family protein [Simplicispira metamorpha]